LTDKKFEVQLLVPLSITEDAHKLDAKIFSRVIVPIRADQKFMDKTEIRLTPEDKDIAIRT
jgi:hypothetical protein